MNPESVDIYSDISPTYDTSMYTSIVVSYHESYDYEISYTALVSYYSWEGGGCGARILVMVES
jgi:hypothetical protein